MAVENMNAEIVRRMSADADLDRPIRIDDAVARGPRHERTMVDPPVVVEPGVLMRVELDKRQRSMLGRMRLEDRPGDKMIAAKGQHEGTAVDNGLRLPFDCCRRLVVIAVVEQAV